MDENIGKNPQMLQLLRFLLIGLGIALAGYGYFGLYKGIASKAKSNLGTPLGDPKQVHDAELKLLDRPGAPPAELAMALLQLSASREPKALQAVIRELGGPSRFLKETAAECLGFYDDASVLPRLKSLLAEPDSELRLRTIRGMSRVRSQERFKTLVEHLKRKDLPAPERAEALLGALKLSNSKAESAELTRQLIGTMKQVKDVAQYASIATNLISANPEDPQVVEMLHAIAAEGKPRTLIETAIWQMARARDPWILKSGPSVLAGSREEGVRAAFLRSIPMSCVPGRWELLTTALRKDSSRVVRQAALEAFSEMPSPTGIAKLNEVIQSKQLTPLDVPDAKKTLEKMAAVPPADPCPMEPVQRPAVAPKKK